MNDNMKSIAILATPLLLCTSLPVVVKAGPPRPISSISHEAQKDYEAAVTFTDQGQPDKAIREYRLALKADPTYAPSHSNLGALLDDKGQVAEAIRECRLAVKLSPKSSAMHDNLGSVLGDASLYDEAICECQYALALDRHNGKAHLNLGVLYYNMHQRDKARVEWQQAIKVGDSKVKEMALNFLAH